MPSIRHRLFTHQPQVEPLGTTVTRIGSRTLLTVKGQLDRAGCDHFGAVLTEIIGRADGDAVIDLSGVTLLDSRGLGSIVRGRKAMRESGHELSVRLPSWAARQALEMSGLGSLIEAPSRVGGAGEAGGRPAAPPSRPPSLPHRCPPSADGDGVGR